MGFRNQYEMLKKVLATFIFFLFINGFAQSQEKPEYSVYLIGDSGAPSIDKPDEVFTNLGKRLAVESSNSAIIFLGDNIYHNGLPPEAIGDKTARKLAEEKLLVQLKAVNDFKGEIYFIPGNHDWNDAKPDGIQYIKAQEEYIEFFLDRGDVLIPDHGCPGPTKEKLGKDIILLAMDSQWWLHPHDDEHGKNSKCKNKNFDEVIDELRYHLDENDDKQIIIALHHPIYSDGSHNGHFTLKQHLFPLAELNKNLMLPLPGLGSLYPFFRSTFGDRQDMAHPLYQELRNEIIDLLYGRKNVILASGHEHNLQYFFKHQNHFVKSGSGSKSDRLPKKTDAIFSDEAKGYAKLEYYKNDVVLLRYFIIENGYEIEKFSEVIVEPSASFGKKKESKEIVVKDRVLPASTKYNKNAFHRLIFGNLYREDWSQKVTFRSMDLVNERGGLKPMKIGGGMSSLSIRLKDKEKKQFVLRSVEKTVSKVVPDGFQNSVIEDVFQDQIAASQPYAALMIPPLAKAIGVYHTNPELVFLPKQPLLGSYNEGFGNQLYLFEERPSGNQEENEFFGNSKKIISYTDMLVNLRTKHGHHIHQDQVLKSRLFDFYLGDWDRHDDQWRWASFKEKAHSSKGKKHTYYEPIPRDRDQAFFKYSGLMPMVAKLISPELRKFQTFGHDIKNLNYLAYNARHFDRSYLNELERHDWLEIGKDIQTNLTPESIAEAINQLPEPIRKLRGTEFESYFLNRKKHLVNWAESYYEFLSKYVDVVGSDEKEAFNVFENVNGSTTVIVLQEGKKNHLDTIYNRTFWPEETKEIRLYGLEDNDKFIVENNATGNFSKIKIRIIGGKGKDRMKTSKDQQRLTNKYFLYDDIDDPKMKPLAGVIDKRSDDYRVNEYNRKEFYYNSTIGIPFFGYDIDNGLSLGYFNSYKKYGFRKIPYSARHDFNIRFASRNTVLSVNYNNHFVDVIGKTDVEVESYFFLPDNVQNFYGLTNEFDDLEEQAPDNDFFRYERSDIFIYPAFSWTNKNQISKLKVGPFFRFIDVLSNEGKFVSLVASGLEATNFDRENYIGIRADYHLEKIDDITYPSKGVSFNFSPSYNHALGPEQSSFSKLYASLTLYNFLWIPKPFVLATKVETGINFGDFNFTQANYIGLNNGLRGFRNNRIGGHSSFSVANDLRLKLVTTKGALPFSFGILGAYDIGRVWNAGEVNSEWHESYGGGVFISPFDIAPIAFYYLRNSNGSGIFSLRLGFSF